MTERTRAEYWGPYAAGAAVAFAFILLLLSGVYTYRQQEHINKQLCKQTVDNRAATRHTWEAARTLVLRGTTSEEGKKRTADFFDEILRSIPELECRDAKPVELLNH